MARAKISANFQIVIPKEIREQAGITSGQTVEVQVKGGVITLAPHRSFESMSGFLRGASTTETRDKKDRV